MTKEGMKAIAIAKCEKCGRGFLSMPRDERDHYYPADKPLHIRDMPTDEECGGAVVLLASPTAQTKE